MQVPLKITFRNVRKTPDIEALIGKQAAKLERVCNHIVSCRMAVEKPQQHQRTGNPFRVRIDVTVPPQHELVVIREASEGDLHERLPTVLRGAFGVMRRQVKKLAEKQRSQVKTHPERAVGGFVSLLLRREAYGFIRSLDGREIYFHENRRALGGGTGGKRASGQRPADRRQAWLPDRKVDRRERGCSGSHSESWGGTHGGPCITTVTHCAVNLILLQMNGSSAIEETCLRGQKRGGDTPL